MHRLYIKIFVLFSVLCSLFSVSYAQGVVSSELIKNAEKYDGKTLVYEGEVIGEVMRRGGGYAWINVYDGRGAIGVWASQDLIRDIVYTGNYKTKGDLIAVTGVFHENCLEHGGDLDLHAQAINKISPGSPRAEHFNFAKRNQALVLGGLCLLIWILMLLQRR